MGNSKSIPPEKITVEDFVTKQAIDDSARGYITYNVNQCDISLMLNYSHPDFAMIFQKLKTRKANRIRYSSKVTHEFDRVKWYQHTIVDVTDVPAIKITGSIVEYIHDRWKDVKDDLYVEVLLDQRPLKIPGYNYYGILLIEKKRIDALSKNIPYEFAVSLFRGANEFLIGEVNAVKGVTLR